MLIEMNTICTLTPFHSLPIPLLLIITFTRVTTARRLDLKDGKNISTHNPRFLNQFIQPATQHLPQLVQDVYSQKIRTQEQFSDVDNFKILGDGEITNTPKRRRPFRAWEIITICIVSIIFIFVIILFVRLSLRDYDDYGHKNRKSTANLTDEPTLHQHQHPRSASPNENDNNRSKTEFQFNHDFSFDRSHSRSEKKYYTRNEKSDGSSNFKHNSSRSSSKSSDSSHEQNSEISFIKALDILGVTEDSTKDEINSAFRHKSLQFHPDKFIGQDESVLEEKALQFRLICQARNKLLTTAGD